MDLYKKHKVGLTNGGKIDIISAFNQVRGVESDHIHSSENMEASDFVSDARVEPKSISDSKIAETLHHPAGEHLKELDQACSPKGQDHGFASSSDHGNEGEPLAALGEKEKETSEMVESGESKDNQSMEVENKSLLVPGLHKDVETLVDDPLIFEDGSSKACDALMAGSNESESLILSRIHHSPESTH